MPKQVIDKQKAIGRIKNIIKNTVSVEIPSDMNNELTMFMESCKLNGISLKNLFTMVFDCGYHLYKKFVTKNITSVPEMERVCSFVEANLESIMELSYTECVFDMSGVVELLKINDKKFFKTFELNDIRSVFGNDKFVMNGNDIRILFNRYVENDK